MDGIEVRGLSVIAGERRLLNNIHISVQSGEVYVLYGSEVGDKRRLLRVLAGGQSSRPLYVDDDSLIADIQISEDICYVLTGAPLYAFMRVEEYMHYMLSLTIMDKAERVKAINAELEALGIADIQRRRLKGLAPIEHKLVALAVQTVTGKRNIIINADDLTFSKTAQRRLNTALDALKKRGTAVIVSVSDSALIGSAVDRIGVFKNGRILTSGTPEQLIVSGTKKTYSFKPDGNLKQIADKFKSLAKDYKVQIRGEKIIVSSSIIEPDLGKSIVEIVNSVGSGLEELRVKTPDLQDALSKAVAQ